MKKLFFILFLPILAFSQDDLASETPKDISQQVDDKSFSKIYNKYLTEAILGDSDLSTLGSYVSVDITKPKLTFAITKNWYGGENDYLRAATTLKFDGGIKDGLSTVFSNEKFNTDINLRLDQSFVLNFCGLTRFKYIEKDDKELKKEIEKIELKESENESYKKVLKKIIKKDSLTVDKPEAYFVAKLKLEELEAKDFKKKIEDKKLEAKWSSVRLVWLNVFAKYGTQKINLYDSIKPFDNQIEKITPENHELGIGLNVYYDQVRDLDATYKNRLVYLLNGQYSIKYSYAETNNSSEISTKKVVTEKLTGSDIGNSRFIEDVTNAYLIGNYDTFKRHQIAIDINKKIIDNLHLHIYGDYNEIESSSKYNGNYKNLGVGLIIGLQKKDKPKEKTIVNFEVFTHFKDLEDKFEETGDKFYKRAIVGVRTTIPFDNLLKRK